jgi:hypothetical protein
MDELTEAQRKAMGDTMERLGWRRFEDTAFGRELDRMVNAITMPRYEEGLKEGYCLAFVGVYQARFGDVPDTLRAAIDAIDARDEDTLRRWVVLAGTGSAEDVAAAILGISDTVSTTG